MSVSAVNSTLKNTEINIYTMKSFLTDKTDVRIWVSEKISEHGLAVVILKTLTLPGILAHPT